MTGPGRVGSSKSDPRPTDSDLAEIAVTLIGLL